MSDTFELRDLGQDVVDRSLVVAVTRSPLNFRFIHWGAERAWLFGADYTGYSVRDVRPKNIARKAREEYVSIVAKRQPVLAGTRIDLSDGTSVTYHALRLPLTDGGVTVDKIVTLYSCPEHRDLVREYYQSQRESSD